MDNPVTPAPPEDESIKALLAGETTPTPAAPTPPPTPPPLPAPTNQPAPGMDVVAAPRNPPTAPAPSSLPVLEKAAPKLASEPVRKKADSEHTPGIGIAITATVIIVIALSGLAVLAFLNQA